MDIAWTLRVKVSAGRKVSHLKGREQPDAAVEQWMLENWEIPK